MYPSVPHEHDKYAADGPPIHSPGGPYIPPYVISSSVRSQGLAVPWSTGLCHCCDDPVNCMYIEINRSAHF